jgi:hypothetical protein
VLNFQAFGKTLDRIGMGTRENEEPTAIVNIQNHNNNKANGDSNNSKNNTRNRFNHRKIILHSFRRFVKSTSDDEEARTV